MVASDVQLCNMALSRIGSAERIQSLTDTTKNEAVQCNLFYAQTRDEVLRTFAWPCAITRKTLSALSDIDLNPYDYAYQLPEDPYCLRVLNLIDLANATYDDLDGTAFEIEGRMLLTDESPVAIKYIRQLTDVADFDSLLVEVLILKLASKIAYPVMESTTIEQDMLKQYLMQMNQAKDVAGTERRNRQTRPKRWVDQA